MGTGEKDIMAIRRAVVQLRAYTPEMDWEQPYNANTPTRAGTGTGFVVDGLPQRKGKLAAVTAYHVVDRAVTIRATLYAEASDADAGRPYEARVIAYSIALDVAVIEIDVARPSWLTPLPTGKSDELMLMQEVRVVGFPMRDAYQITTGFVSGRTPNRLQIDASVNPGASGGPLVSNAGRVVGVVVSGLDPSAAQNVNFCTPYEDVILKLFPELSRASSGAKPRSVPLLSFNFSLAPAAPDVMRELTGGKCTGGAAVTRVNAASDAHARGLREGDFVCSVDGLRVSFTATVQVAWWSVDALAYTAVLSRKRIGQKMPLEFYSRADAQVRTVELEIERDMDLFQQLDLDATPAPYSRLGGLTVQPLNVGLFESSEALQKRYAYVLLRPQLQQTSLLVITYLDPASPFTLFDQARVHDVIVAVNDEPIPGGDLAAYEAAFRKARESGTVMLHTYTGGLGAATDAALDAFDRAQTEEAPRR